MKKNKPSRPTKRESLRARNHLITHLRQAEALEKNIRSQLKDNVSKHFGLQEGDEVVYVGAPGEPVRIFAGVVKEVRFHFPQKITRNNSIGAVVVHKWKQGNGPNKLMAGGNKYEIVTHRDVLNLIRRPSEDARIYRGK